jgi:hypothetical protein
MDLETPLAIWADEDIFRREPLLDRRGRATIRAQRDALRERRLVEDGQQGVIAFSFHSRPPSSGSRRPSAIFAAIPALPSTFSASQRR